LRDAFERGPGHGLLWLGTGEAGTALPPVYSYWREFGARVEIARTDALLIKTGKLLESS